MPMKIGYYGVILHECQQRQRGIICDSEYFSRHLCRKLCSYKSYCNTVYFFAESLQFINQRMNI